MMWNKPGNTNFWPFKKLRGVGSRLKPPLPNPTLSLVRLPGIFMDSVVYLHPTWKNFVRAVIFSPSQRRIEGLTIWRWGTLGSTLFFSDIYPECGSGQEWTHAYIPNELTNNPVNRHLGTVYIIRVLLSCL